MKTKPKNKRVDRGCNFSRKVYTSPVKISQTTSHKSPLTEKDWNTRLDYILVRCSLAELEDMTVNEKEQIRKSYITSQQAKREIIELFLSALRGIEDNIIKEGTLQADTLDTARIIELIDEWFKLKVEG